MQVRLFVDHGHVPRGVSLSGDPVTDSTLVHSWSQGTVLPKGAGRRGGIYIWICTLSSYPDFKLSYLPKGAGGGIYIYNRLRIAFNPCSTVEFPRRRPN